MTTMLTETRERFLLAIVKHVPAERIAEIYFFQPIQQGGVESGVAVVAELGAGGSELGDAGEQTDVPEESVGSEIPQPPALSPQPRYVIHTARYRLTLKGPDRGKWEANVVAEADAPLVTLEAVVRGVQRRAGDVDDATRMEGDEVRALVDSVKQ